MARARSTPCTPGVQRWVRDLNRLYRETRALHELDFSAAGFQWVDCDDADVSVICLPAPRSRRRTPVLIVCNFTPVPRDELPRRRSRAAAAGASGSTATPPYYGGSGQGNLGALEAQAVASHGFAYSLVLRLPPLAILILTPG